MSRVYRGQEIIKFKFLKNRNQNIKVSTDSCCKSLCLA